MRMSLASQTDSFPIPTSVNDLAFTPDRYNHPKNGSQWALNFKCKRKQYYGVLWTIQFLKPFLDAALTSVREVLAPPRIATNATHDGKEQRVGSNFEQESSAEFLELEARVLEWKKSMISTLEEVGQMMEGAPASLQHLGPISAHHLNALGSASFESCIAALLSSNFFWLSVLPTSRTTCGNIFPVQSELCSVLWPEELSARYVEDLRENRAKRVKYYRDLTKEGYLFEAGLHSLDVFTGGAPSTSREFDTDAGKAVAAKWRTLIDDYTLFLPDRTRYHELENLPQEVAIGELVVDCVSKVSNACALDRRKDPDNVGLSTRNFQADCVVDVGGGNGFLVAQISEKLGCRGVVVDPSYPAHSIDCCPRIWPDTADRVRPPALRKHFIDRHIALFRDTQWSRDIGVDPDRCVLIAKHLCGTAADECLRHLQCQNCFPRILILVPCCFNKGSLAEYINFTFLSDVLNINDAQSFDHLTRLTDWNESIHQREVVKQDLPRKGIRGGRRGGKKSVKQLIPFTGVLVKTVEALLNHGRILWLQEHGYKTSFVEYVPNIVTPKNKCIVAYRPE